MWIGCVIAYNEAPFLAGCLESLCGDVDRLIVVEGRIGDFPGDSYTSDDATLAIARQYTDEVITPDSRAWETEQQMRSQYLRGRDGDWYCILDADEVLISPLPRIDTLTENVYRIRLSMMGCDASGDRQIRRLYRHTGHMEYRNAHDALYSNDNLVSNGDETYLPHVQAFHRQPLRSAERRALKRIKRKRTQDREREFRNHLAELMHHVRT